MEYKSKKIFLIEWMDSCMSDDSISWKSIDSLESPPDMLCYSVGWIVKESERFLTIAPHVSEIENGEVTGQICGEMNIPKKSITKKIELKLYEI